MRWSKGSINAETVSTERSICTFRNECEGPLLHEMTVFMVAFD